MKVFGGNRLVFGLPKGDKTRTVPLPDSVANELSGHLAAYPRRDVTLHVGDSRRGKKYDGGAHPHYTGAFSSESQLLQHADLEARPGARSVSLRSRDNGMHALRHWYASICWTPASPSAPSRSTRTQRPRLHAAHLHPSHARAAPNARSAAVDAASPGRGASEDVNGEVGVVLSRLTVRRRSPRRGGQRSESATSGPPARCALSLWVLGLFLTTTCALTCADANDPRAQHPSS